MSSVILVSHIEWCNRDSADCTYPLPDMSDSEEHFSDAHSAPSSESHPTSPIPKTRVERVDDKPAYGEVPGTAAYQMREEDAAPDEIAYVPEPNSAPETVPGAEQDGTPISEARRLHIQVAVISAIEALAWQPRAAQRSN